MQYRKKLKAEKQLALRKYPLKYGRQRNLTTYIFNYAALCINKIQRNEQKVASSPSSRKANFESLRTTEV